jgi:hypothetical protein
LVLDRGAQADARGTSLVLGRGAQALTRGGAHCASHVLDRSARPFPAAALVGRRRYLIVFPKPLPAAPLVVRSRKLAVVPRPFAARGGARCAPHVTDRGAQAAARGVVPRPMPAAPRMYCIVPRFVCVCG